MAVLDEGDLAYRAPRAATSPDMGAEQGLGMPRYGVDHGLAAGMAGPAARAARESGIDVHLEQQGGLHVLLSDEEGTARIDS